MQLEKIGEMTPIQLLKEILFTRLSARLLMVIISLFAAIFGLLAPLFQRDFLNYLMNNKASSHFLNFDLQLGPWPLLLLAVLSLTLSMILAQWVMYLGTRESLLLQRTLAQRLYDQTIGLRAESLRGRPIGEIVSVYTTDIPGSTILLEQSLPQGLSIFFPLILAPLILIYEFHIPLVHLLISLGVLLIFNFWLAHRQSHYFYLFKKLAADRIAVVNEWIQNIRALRVLGWVDAFESKIHAVRIIETKNRISMLINGQSMNAVSSSISYFLNFAVMLYIVQFATVPLEPAALLTLLWIVAVFLTRPFRQLPWFFTFLFDAWTSIQRVHEILSLHEMQNLSIENHATKKRSPTATGEDLKVEGLNYYLGPHRILSEVSFEAREGELLAIVGEVGSGKSSLLMSLLRENSAQFRSYSIGGTDMLQESAEDLRAHFSLVPQDTFIMSATVLENTLLDYGAQTQDEQRTLESLKLSDFDPTEEGLLKGLSTDIGERGVNLSGGQRQRINLARADLFKAPILLLDDCLSAVDVNTERKLMKNLIQGEWNKRTRILVSHRLSVLKEVDRILFMKDGTIIDQGGYSELFTRNALFREFTASVNKGTT